MSLVYKSSVRENVTDIQTYIVDDSPKSTKYFRVSDVPQVLQKGKNLLRITAHPTNLVPGTQVYVDVRDSNGNAIYYEIPDYLEDDKSRVISIWIYHDKGDDNTPNGEATITLAGIANVDMDGNPLPSRHRDKINVKWQTTVTVDRERSNTSEVIFNSTNLPIVSISQSIEQYQNQPQDGEGLNLTSQTGKVQYIFRGETPIIEIKDSSTFNSEMVDGSIILNNFSEPAEPINKLANPLSSTFFSSSIKEVLTNKVLKTATNFTTSFENRPDVIHTFNRISEADYKIEYFKTGSNISTENKRNFANLTFSNVDPITGVVDKIKVLQKSDGLPGEFELLNEVSVPFSSSFDIKVPIPSKNLKDPKILKLLYLNSEGGISRTETISKAFVFDGDNVYIGGSENLISGSIFISNTLGTGIEIGGASSGFIRSVGFEGQTSASIGEAPGGFVIYSGSGNLVMGVDQLNGVGMQFIGDNDDRHLIFTTDNGGILDVKTDKFFVGTSDTQFISGSDGNIEISSSIFHLDPAANGGDGSLIIGANATILSDLTVDNLRTPATIDGVASTEANSSSSIKADGFARFVSASVGGWDITTASIEGGNLLMKPEGLLQTRDFASGLKGWKISSEGNGTAEFENIRIRGTLRTTTFEKESVNAVGGQLWVANSTTITGSVGLSDTTMSVKNASGFSAGEILLIKKVDSTGFQTEYVLLNSASIDGDNSGEDETHGRIMVTRAYGSGESGDFVGDLASAAQSYEDGQVVVSTGKLNTGYIKMNANPNDTATPFIDIVERTGSGLYDVALKARLGDLSGLANSTYVFGNSNPGFGLATDNVYLQGGIIANTGSIGGINMDAGKLFTGGGNYNNSDTGFYVDSGSQFSLGTKLVWNPTTEALVIRGQLQLSDGTDVGTAIENVSTPTGSVARVVSLAADKYVVTFDADGNENPSGQTIVLTATPQNFGTATVYYEFYKDSTIQGSRSTTATFDVDTSLEKPTATSPVTYEVRTFTGSDGGTSISSDSLTLFGIQPGSDGNDGVDAVTAFLTNESHTLPLSSSGDVTSYAGADTLMKVFEGITDSSSNYTYTVSTPSHITATSSSNSVTITATTTPHSGSVTITAASSSVSLAKTMSIAVARQGDDGTDGTPGVNGDSAKTLIASVDSQVFAFDDSTDNSATPSSILFSFSQQNLSGTIAASDITITTDDSNSVTNFSFDNNNVSDGSGIVSGSISYTGALESGGLNGSKDSLPLTISCTKDSLTDSIKVFKVEGGSDGAAGSDAVTAFLTNESHTLPAQNDGTVVSFDGATTDMEVFEGITNKTNVYTFTTSSTTSVSSSISDNTVTVTSMAHDSGSIVITATSESVSLSKTMTLAKSKQGTAGLAGSDAKLLTLTSDSQVFAFPSASSSTAIDNDILIIVNQQNLSGTIGAGDITIKDADGYTLSDPTFVASVTDGTGQVSGSITFSGTVGGNKDKLPLTIEVAKDSLEDSLKIFKVEGGSDGTNGADGADAVTAFLTNESHTFPADSSGSIASFTGGTTDMQVFEGITDVTNNYTFTRSSTTSVSSSISDNTITVTSMGHDSGSITINAASSSVSIDKIMSLTKARQGADGGDGTSAKLLAGSLDSQVFSFLSASDNTSDPSEIIFSFNQQNLSGTIDSSDITISTAGGNVTNFGFDNNDVSSGTGVVSGSISFAGALNSGGLNSTKSNLPVTITATKDSLSDSIKIFKVEGGTAGADGSDGVNAVTAILTNDSHTLPVSSSGEVISFAGASTDIIVFEGTSDVTSQYTINTGSVSSHITTTTSDNTVTITNSTTPFSGSVVVTATSASVSLAKTMSISQALQGDDGADGAPGSDAKIVTLTGDSQVFTFPSASATTPDDNTIELFINQQNLSGTIAASDVTITDVDGTSQVVPTFAPTSLTNGTGVVSGSLVFGTNTPNGSNKDKFPITISVTKDSVSDTFKIFSLDGGADGTNGEPAKSVALTATSQIIAYDADGANPDVASITLTATSQNFTDAYFKFTGAGSAFSNESSYTDGSGANSDTATFTVPTSYSSTPYTFTVRVQEGNSGGEVARDTITIASVQPGAQGDDAFTVVLTNESHTLTQTSPQAGGTIDFVGSGTEIIAYKGTTQLDSVSGTPGSGEFKVTATGIGITAGSIDVSGNNAIVADHSSMTAVSASIGYDINLENTVTLAKSQSFSISQAADSGSDGAAGAGGITVILSNESHTIAAGSDGTVASFSGAETDVTIFEGVTDKTTEYFIHGVSNTGVTVDNDFNSFNSSSLNITDMSHDSGSVIITSISGGVPHTGYGAGVGETWTTSQFVTNNQGDIDGTDNDFHYQSNPDTISVGTGDGELRNNYVEFGDNSGDDEVWIVGKDIVAYDDTKTYYVEARFKRINGSGTIYVGVTGWANETTRTNINGANSFGGQHYIAASGFNFDDGEGTDWVTMRGYFSGHSSTTGQLSGEAPDINNPKKIHTNAAYISPMFLANYNDVAGTVRLDYIEIKEVKDGSGNLSAGTVKVDKTMTLAKSKAGTDGAEGPTGPEGPNFDFLSGSLDTVNTTGGLSAGLLMTSNVFGFHGPIDQGDGTNAQLSDFTSFLDSGGSFYLGGNSSGMSGSAATSGYLAWNNTDRSLLISGSNANIQVEKFFVGNSTTQFVSGSNGNLEISGSNFHLDSSGNVKVSGEITVTNSGDFANPNAEPPIIYDFSGNGSQTITNNQVFRTVFDTDGTYAGGSGFAATQNPSTEGIYLGSNFNNQAFSDGLLSKNTQQRANNPILNWDFKIQNTGTYTSADIGIFKNNSDLSRASSPNGGNMLYGIRLNQDDILVRTYENEGTATTYSSQFVAGDVLRLQIRVKSEGGAELAIFKNGDFTTPIVTYSYGTDGSDSTMTIGYTNATYQMAGHILKYVAFGVGAPSSTVISGNGISTGAIQSSTLTTTSGTEIDLDAAKFKIGGTGAYESNNGILMDGPNALFAVGRKGSSYNYMTFNSASSGKLEINTDNFKVKADGQVTASALLIDGSAQIADTVQIGGSSDGTVIFFDDFTTYAALSDCLTDNDDPKTDGSGQGYHLVDSDGLADTSLLSGQSDTFNNNGGLLRIGDNEGDDVIWASSNTLIPINPNSLYEYEIRLRKPLALGGTDGQYAGFTVYDSDGTTKRSQSDTDVFGSAHYFVLSNSDIGTDFETHKGFIKGFGDATSTTSTTKTTPTVFETGAENGYFAPMFLANWNGQAGRVEIDYIKVTEYAQGGGSSRISGDTITTGVIKSNNLNADSGSQILLNDGSMKMGGTASPGFEVTTEGFVTATNLVEKMVEVSADNSGSYFEYYDSTKTRLLLDGSGGGDVTMNLTLGVAPEYTIHDIQFPSNTTGLDIAKLELTIATTESVNFDDASISSGFFSFGLSLSSKEFSLA